MAAAFNRLWFLVLPAFAIFLLFFLLPVLALLAIAFNPAKSGVVLFQPTLTLANFARWVSTSLYQQISEQGNWQFGATIAVILFAISLSAVYVYHRYTEMRIGGLL